MSLVLFLDWVVFIDISDALTFFLFFNQYLGIVLGIILFSLSQSNLFIEAESQMEKRKARINPKAEAVIVWGKTIGQDSM